MCLILAFVLAVPLYVIAGTYVLEWTDADNELMRRFDSMTAEQQTWFLLTWPYQILAPTGNGP